MPAAGDKKSGDQHTSKEPLMRLLTVMWSMESASVM
jgi:hypothetical protein